MTSYPANRSRRGGNKKRWWIIALIIAVVVAGAAFAAYKIWLSPKSGEQAASQLQFDQSVAEEEQQIIRGAVKNQNKTYDGTIDVSVQTTTETAQALSTLSAYVPVVNVYDTRQAVSNEELASLDVYVAQNTNDTVKQALAEAIGIGSDKLKPLASVTEIPDGAVAFIPSNELNANIKLLTLGDKYYLDNFTSGAVFRQAEFNGQDAANLADLTLNALPSKDQTLKVNMTGVTALTRGMIKKLPSVGSATYYSEKIGPFLADADITHVSNEVSFKEGCEYSYSVFCSPPEMIEALKSSGVDLVEITGNHNNDVGSQYNTDTINQYHDLGWATFGGGLNATEAAKPFVSDQKGSKVAFLGYNFADAPGSGAIATAENAGANGWNAEKVKADIAAAKEQSDFVIVDIQFWECYSYPDGYIEYPQCDVPIGQQADVFRQAADFGADMVIGSSAHQPQTYEIYNDKPIYYGLGNLYFDQVQWPGTERGIILTHYFQNGKLTQTKLTPTVYHSELQTEVMNSEDATYLLDRLKAARTSAGL